MWRRSWRFIPAALIAVVIVVWGPAAKRQAARQIQAWSRAAEGSEHLVDPLVEEAPASWIVSGAGLEAYNGQYTDSGRRWEGQAVYTNGAKWLSLNARGAFWVLVDSFDLKAGPEPARHYYGTGTVLPANPWYPDIPPYEPAPTVSAVEEAQPSSWVITGVGDHSYNGTYTRNSTVSGKPAYTNGRRWLIWHQASRCWSLGGVAAPNWGGAYVGAPGAELPAKPWQQGPALGAAPAPGEIKEGGGHGAPGGS